MHYLLINEYCILIVPIILSPWICCPDYAPTSVLIDDWGTGDGGMHWLRIIILHTYTDSDRYEKPYSNRWTFST